MLFDSRKVPGEYNYCHDHLHKYKGGSHFSPQNHGYLAREVNSNTPVATCHQLDGRVTKVSLFIQVVSHTSADGTVIYSREEIKEESGDSLHKIHLN